MVGAGFDVVAVWCCGAVVGVDLPRVVVVLRPIVVPEPEVVGGPLELVVPATVVVVDDVGVTWRTISFGLPAELGTPATRTPSPMDTRRRRTMPARRAAGPCQSMAPEPNETKFFCGGSISGPTAGCGQGANSNGPVRPYERVSTAAGGHSNTVPTPCESPQKRRSGV